MCACHHDRVDQVIMAANRLRKSPAVRQAVCLASAAPAAGTFLLVAALRVAGPVSPYAVLGIGFAVWSCSMFAVAAIADGLEAIARAEHGQA